MKEHRSSQNENLKSLNKITVRNKKLLAALEHGPLLNFLAKLNKVVTGQANNSNLSVMEYAEELHNYYENIIACMPNNVYWLDRNCVLLGGNDNFAKMFGLKSRSELVGLTYEQMSKLANWTADQGESFKKADLEVMDAGIPRFNIDEPAVVIDGKTRFYMASKVPLYNLKGKVIGILGISTDITERKQAEATLQEAKMARESEFYKIIDAVPASIYWKDKSGRYLGCNKYMLEMAGLEHPSKVIGKKDDELAWKSIAEKLFEIDQNVIINNRKIEIEENPTLANQQERIFLTTKTPLIDITGEIRGLIGVSVDITERKKNEIAVKEAKEKAIKEAKEKAEAANRAKTEFLENMRHDMRTPLIGITGFASIISDEINDPKIKEYVNNLTASSYALLDLLNEILEVVKINSGDIPLLKKKFDIKKRLSDVIRLNQAKARYKNLTLTFEHDPNIPTYVIGDPTRTHRIALELIANALNFTDKGYVKLSTQLAKTSERGLVMKLTVEDTGIGIAPNKQQEIFIQFKRLIPSYEGIYKGAGLGLPIVKQFLDEIEGEVYVESQVGIGTKFTCLIPLKQPLTDDEFGCEEFIPSTTKDYQTLPKTQFIDKISANPENTATTSRILVVEDQNIASMVVKNMLFALDCQIDIASDGKTATQLAQENFYDLIFMDIGLPDIDGYEVTRRLRLYELNKGTHIPIIALTAHIDEENKQRCIEVGMNAVLSKPLIKEKAEDILNAFIPFRKKYQENLIKSEQKEETNPLILEGKVVDFELARKQIGGNAKTLNDLLTHLAESLPEEIENLHVAYSGNDWTTIQGIAHKLKGGASYCGTTRLQEACSRLENAIKTNKKDILNDLYKQMTTEIYSVEEVIKNRNYF